MEKMWLEDLAAGQTRTTGTYEMTTSEIIGFARNYDPQPFHVDDVAARDSFFDGLAASGWHTAAVTMRLLITEGFVMEDGSIGLGVQLEWPTATRPGDQLRVVVTVKEVRRSASKPDRGIVVLDCDTVNQDDEIRQHMVATCMVWARGEA